MLCIITVSVVVDLALGQTSCDFDVILADQDCLTEHVLSGILVLWCFDDGVVRLVCQEDALAVGDEDRRSSRSSTCNPACQ